jgi:hypothetical protein
VANANGRAGCSFTPARRSTSATKAASPWSVDGVLEPRVLAVAAVAEVALRGDHGLGDREQPARAEEADHVGQPRVGLASPWVAPRPPPTVRLKPTSVQRIVLDDGDEAEVLGEDVDVVDGGTPRRP